MKIEVSSSEIERLSVKLKRAKTLVNLLWLSLGSNPSPELIDSALTQISEELHESSPILAKLEA